MTSQGEITWTDRLIAFIWALLVGAIAFFANKGGYIPVESADSLAVAFNLRPPQHLAPLLWHNLVGLVSSHFGIAPTIRILHVLGLMSLALLAFLSAGVFAALLPSDLRTWVNAYRTGRRITYVLPILGSAVFVFSPSVWSQCRMFTPETQMLVLFVLSVFIAVRSLKRSSTSGLVLSSVVSGVLSAEMPFAFLVPVITIVFLYRRDCESEQDAITCLDNPLVQMALVKWMVCGFISSWICTIALNMHFFVVRGGVGFDDGIFFLIVKLFMHYFFVIYRSMTPFGLMVLCIMVVAPLVFSVVRIKQATDITTFLFFRHGFFFFLFGILALLQSSPFSSWWFWRWASEVEAISSRFVLTTSMMATAYIVFAAICVFVVDVYFRNDRFLAREYCWNEQVDIPMIVKVTRSLKLTGRYSRFVMFPLIVVLVFSCVISGRFDSTVAKAEKIVGEYVDNVVYECGKSPILITDGTLDSAIELTSVTEGKNIKTLSIMSGGGDYDIALRKRIDADGKHLDALKFGTAETMRNWMREGSPMISNLAVQVGFELWRDNNKQMPLCGGFVALTTASNDVSKVKSAHSLAEELLLFRERCNIHKIDSYALRSALSRIQWRLSRMCRMRAYAANLVNDADTVTFEELLANRLDDANPEWVKVRDAEEKRLRRNALVLTSREGLNLSLKRADFRLASSYAREVLAEDDGDVFANFALGMRCLEEHKFRLAEGHLKQALLRAPEEPAILNNLAVVLIRLNRFDEAETNAVKALKILPNSSEIKETLHRIKELKTQQK